MPVQNIGTCVTAVAASVGANKNARRAGLLHLMFNLMGSLFWLGIFWGSRLLFSPAFFEEPASLPGIAQSRQAFFHGLCRCSGHVRRHRLAPVQSDGRR